MKNFIVLTAFISSALIGLVASDLFQSKHENEQLFKQTLIKKAETLWS